MERFFTNYRINREVDRSGVNLLMKNIRKRTNSSSIVVFTAVNQFEEPVQENWFIKKRKDGKFKYSSFDKRDNVLKTTILNYLSYSDVIIVVIVCDMKQKIDKERPIKEMWGFKILSNGKKTSFEEITSEDIYKYSTTNITTGKSMPPTKEIVYCGPDGKICGWDMI